MSTTQAQAGLMRVIFSRLAPYYDLVNRVISLGRDRAWRSQALALAQGDGLVLDLATGTGDMATVLAQKQRVIGIDLCPEMLALGRAKAARMGLSPGIDFILADALALPFADNSFDCITVGFALRNVARLSDCFAEIRRVLKPGGRAVCLELTRPRSRLISALHRPYLCKAIPLIGHRLSGQGAAYDYLASSVLGFPTPEELGQIMGRAGLRQVSYRRLDLGVVAVHTGLK